MVGDMVVSGIRLDSMDIELGLSASNEGEGNAGVSDDES